MQILRPVETISTDDIINMIETLPSLAFIFGFIGGIALILLLIGKNSPNALSVAGTISSIILVIFVFWADRHMKKKIIPELRKRYQHVSPNNASELTG